MRHFFEVLNNGVLWQGYAQGFNDMSGYWNRESFYITILENHIDTLGHVNHATYLQLLELARWDAVTQHGMGLENAQKTEIGPVIIELTIRYKRELKLRQKIRIDTQVEEFDGKIGALNQGIFTTGPEGDVCHATAHIKFAVFDMNTRKLVPPSTEWRKAVGWVESSQ